MSAPARLAAFGAVLAALFGGAVAAGAVLEADPAGEAPVGSAAPAAPHEAGGHATTAEEDHATTAKSPSRAGEGSAAAHPVRGLAVAEDGLRLVVDDPELRRGRAERLRFRVVDERGRTVRAFDVEHEKRMHLILARRDLTGFQHLHPEQGDDGAWTTRVRLEEAGSYRLFADFTRDGEPHTLASDLRVDGPADLRPLPAPDATAVSDGGYDVRLDAGRTRPGEEAELRFTIARDGVPVHPEPYLGAGGHLVALREHDLAFLHVHPTGHGDQGAGAAHDDAVAFSATFPTQGRYRLFLQFKHEGRVHTVAFTQEVSWR